LYIDCISGDEKEFCSQSRILIETDRMLILWSVIYWSTYVLCWTAYPFLQNYVTSAEFTVYERVLSSIRQNLILLAICSAIFGFILFLVAINKGFDPEQIIAVAIAAANTWGLFLLICFLGHGLVEVPRRLWRYADKATTLKYYQYRVVFYQKDYEKWKSELANTLKLVKKYSEIIPMHDPFRPYIDLIVSKCPSEYNLISRGEGGSSFQPSFSKLLELHKRLILAQHEAVRSKCVYEELLRKAFDLEDILKSRNMNYSKREIRWSFREKRIGHLAGIFSFLGRIQYTQNANFFDV